MSGKAMGGREENTQAMGSRTATGLPLWEGSTAPVLPTLLAPARGPEDPADGGDLSHRKRRRAPAFPEPAPELEALEEAAQGEMLHLLGESSAMLLHELRSPLQAVSAQLQVVCRLLQRELGDRHDARFTLVFDELRRMDGLLEQFLQLASRRPPQWGPVELRRLCLESSQLLRSLCLSQGVELTLAEGPDLPPVSGDQGPLRQVLTNLVVNGAQACRGTGRPGRVRISLEEEQGPAGYFQLVRVWDNGCGLPPGDRERLFRPYFTTKDRGSGLGLAISRRIAEAHGGELLCADRTDGPGAVFTLRLPGEGKSGMNTED